MCRSYDVVNENKMANIYLIVNRADMAWVISDLAWVLSDLAWVLSDLAWVLPFLIFSFLNIQTYDLIWSAFGPDKRHFFISKFCKGPGEWP